MRYATTRCGVFSLTGDAGLAELFQFSSIIKCCCRQDYRHCDTAPEENVPNHVKTTSERIKIFYECHSLFEFNKHINNQYHQ